MPLRKTPFKSFGAQGESGIRAAFLGYFSLAEQRKVSRLSGRDPTSKSSRRASDTFYPLTPTLSRKERALKNHSNQFSINNPGTRSNSRRLLLTNIKPWLRA